MSTTHLAAKYRPQTFAQVAGQDAIKAALSRAAQQDRIAPAYLFSGTRGVGKTTIARILAKALNCETAPTAEPCNQCRFCRQITAGAQVDVVEMDAASHTGVDNVRQLKEDIGYAPMEARYKVFIIDEAHMLSKAAFNALLKTLEEPPPHATFIMASTEAEKFPATIISRCQHYLFKPLPMSGLAAHLTSVLERENAPFEPEAVTLIARRGAGSVRDSMSLLGQALTLMNGETLTAQGVREVLGLAGREIFEALLTAFQSGDCLAAGKALKQVLDQGLDLGFFMRELTQLFRGLFLLKQSGEGALELLDMPADDARALMPHAQAMSLARIHASWQLVLEGQRRVNTSLEPAVALELLIYNLASLDRLLPLGPGSAGNPEAAPRQQAPAPSAPAPQAAPQPQEPEPKPVPEPDIGPDPEPAPEPESAASAPAGPPAGLPTWEAFADWAMERVKAGDLARLPLLKGLKGRAEGNALVLECPSDLHYDQLQDPAKGAVLADAAREYFGRAMEIRAVNTATPYKTAQELKAELKEHTAVKTVMEHFGVTDFSLVRSRTPTNTTNNGD